MADVDLTSPQTRLSLAIRNAPYWLRLERGLHLGYLRGKRGGSWLVRRQDQSLEQPRLQVRIGIADDSHPSDGLKILSFAQAKDVALAKFPVMTTREKATSMWVTQHSMVRHAVTNYLGWMEEHRARSCERSSQMARQYILHEPIAEIPIVSLTKDAIIQWHLDIANHLKGSRSKKEPSVKRRIPLDATDETKRIKEARKSTANRVLGFLKAALNYENKLTGGPIANPAIWSEVHSFKDAGVDVARALTLGEQKRLVEACDPSLGRLVQGALLTGLRFSELAGLRRRMVIEGMSRLGLPPTKGDSRKRVKRHLIEEAKIFLEQQIKDLGSDDFVFKKADGEPWKKNDYVRPLQAALKAASLGHLRFHDLRHCFATTMLQNRIEPLLVAKALGHADLRMLNEHYEHLMDDYMDDAYKRGSAWIGLTGPRPRRRR
ncbi:tyrosine-type recombinase/integrase [Mesoterricola silvestris]|uniref:Tyr recombinase domain-containing protein n=1 Tax=Mesoterricola silvestris TaxID=2927979 RepID=A0AA48GHT1_9BACT|nr:site-specific integrase [Mesoterricola silvestris]BDU73136.1 hypothetical protein METEAL_23100 [Mesoterricola silvestris]